MSSELQLRTNKIGLPSCWYEFDIVYKVGASNMVADALSLEEMKTKNCRAFLDLSSKTQQKLMTKFRRIPRWLKSEKN